MQTSDPRIKVSATPGCVLLRHIDAVDRLVAEGGKRKQQVEQDLLDQVEEEKRQSITDPYQCLLYDTKAKNKKGNFKGKQGEEIVQRIRDIPTLSTTSPPGEKTLDLSHFTIFDDYLDLLAPFLKSKTCTLTKLK